jgi:hypothetical protein
VRRAWPAYVVLACTLLLTFGAWRYAEWIGGRWWRTWCRCLQRMIGGDVELVFEPVPSTGRAQVDATRCNRS